MARRLHTHAAARDPGRKAEPRPEESRAAEAELWRRWRGAGDADARGRLVELHTGYARSIAARLYARRPTNDVEFDEYAQLGAVGLLEAIDRYEPERGALFTTFAMSRIRGAILTGLERLTERHQQSAFRRRALAERLATLLPEGRVVGRARGILDELEEIGVGVALGLLLEGSGMFLRPEEGLPDDAYAQVELRGAHDRLWALTRHLTERERQVVELHYGQARRFEEIARTLGLTKGRISQLHQQAVERLRALMRATEGVDIAY
jgi:RNA polymerase sigma factor for flagellar operon FliA